MHSINLLFLVAALAKQELDFKLTVFDLKRLELYSQNMIDYHLIMDLMPAIAELYFLQRLPDLHLSAVQQVKAISFCFSVGFFFLFIVRVLYFIFSLPFHFVSLFFTFSIPATPTQSASSSLKCPNILVLNINDISTRLSVLINVS